MTGGKRERERKRKKEKIRGKEASSETRITRKAARSEFPWWWLSDTSSDAGLARDLVGARKRQPRVDEGETRKGWRKTTPPLPPIPGCSKHQRMCNGISPVASLLGG